MIPSIQFDPFSLAIWTSTGNLGEEAADRAAAVMAAAVRGDDLLPVVAELAENDLHRRNALWLASCIWHEKRHFFDTCMTNYGARRFRDMFKVAANFWPVVLESKKHGAPVWFPTEVYGCRVDRRICGILEPSPDVAEIGYYCRTLKKFGASANEPARGAGKVLELGGDAQLEGLAHTSQVLAIEHRFGVEEAAGIVAEKAHRLPREGPYRTIEAVAGSLGCFKRFASTMLVNPGLASALFITALSGRFFGVGREEHGELAMPWLRLARLADELGSQQGRFEMSDEDAWELVDGISRRVWGRTALEEIAADIDAMDAAVSSDRSPVLDKEELLNAWSDFIALRRRLLAAVQRVGPASLSPRAFSREWLDRLLPLHVVATPGGSSDIGNDGDLLFGLTLNVQPGLEQVLPQVISWARLTETPADQGGTSFAITHRSAWLEVLRTHEPRALLMLNGRRHRLMVPPSLDGPIEQLAKCGLEVRL